MIRKLYGDGIHDDTAVLQDMIDNAGCELTLPQPEVCYLISAPLELPSNFKLTLPRFAEVKLAAGSDCFMLKNKTRYLVSDPSLINYSNLGEMYKLYGYLEWYAPDAPCQNIEVCGGVWNCNNLEQSANPLYTRIYENGYSGFGMLFYNVKGLTLRQMTLKDPVNFAITFDRVSYFTVEDIDFDFNYGNPYAINMDGVHLNGNCHFGLIRNLKGTCYDDTVALNADEGSCGPITNIEICGIWAENNHSAVRLLSCEESVENIHVHDIYGTYYQYCVGLTKYYSGDTAGRFSNITIDNIYASKAERLNIYQKDNTYVYPIIYLENEINITDVTISDIHRIETETPVETIYLGKDVEINMMSIRNVHTENKTGKPMPAFVNNGKIKKLHMANVETNGDPVLVNNGEIVENI